MGVGYNQAIPALGEAAPFIAPGGAAAWGIDETGSTFLEAGPAIGSAGPGLNWSAYYTFK